LFSDLESVDIELVNRIIRILPDGFKERVERYKQINDRRRSAISYAMLVYMLKKYFGIKQFDVGFSEYGKPYLKNAPNVHFNISHSKNACICAVSECEIGADIQNIRTFSQKLAKRVCSEAELVVLEKAEDKAAEFTRIWAMKESYVKMIGRGLAYGLEKADTTLMKNTLVFRNNDCYIAVAENKNADIAER